MKKRLNFACGNYISPKTRGNKNKPWTHSTPLKLMLACGTSYYDCNGFRHFCAIVVIDSWRILDLRSMLILSNVVMKKNMNSIYQYSSIHCRYLYFKEWVITYKLINVHLLLWVKWEKSNVCALILDASNVEARRAECIGQASNSGQVHWLVTFPGQK